jgi:hypothetical protein
LKAEEELNQRPEEVVEPRLVVGEEQSREHLELVAVVLPGQLPCTAGSIGRRLHIHHKLHKDLHYHSIERIEQHSRYRLLNFRHQVLMGL